MWYFLKLYDKLKTKTNFNTFNIEMYIFIINNNNKSVDILYALQKYKIIINWIYI